MTNVKYAKAMKIISVILMIFMLVSCTSPVFADVTAKPDDFKGTDPEGLKDVKDLGNNIIGIITTIGIIISVLVLVILGIKYMIGSASEKAEYKKTMIPYIIGAILVFAASSIATIVMNVAGSF